MSQVNIANASEAVVVKNTFGDYNKAQFIQSSPVFGLCKKITGFTGSEKKITFRGSAGAGVGAGVGGLPEASQHDFLKAVLTRKTSYARIDLDRQSVEATRDNKGAFVSFLSEYNEVAVTSFNLNAERQIVANDIAGAGALAVGGATADVVLANSNEFTITLPATSNMYHFQVGHLVNINTESTRLKVINIDHDLKTVTLKGASTRLTAIMAELATDRLFEASDAIYMQGSKDAELPGIRGVLLAAPGAVYKTQTIGNNWKSENKDASGALISTQLLNEVIVKMFTKTGKNPSVIMMSPTQYTLLLDQLEDQKTYNVPAKEYKGKISYSAIEYQSTTGPIPIMMNRFVPSAEVFLLDMNEIELHMIDMPKWLGYKDGTVLRDREEQDAYEGRYGVYWDLFVNPNFQGIIRNLALVAS